LATYTDKIVVRDAGVIRNFISTDSVVTNADWTFGDNVIISGDLTVNGTTTTINSQQLNVEDNNILLNSTYTTVAGRTGGLTVNYLPIATTDTVATGGFVAGIAATSNPNVKTVGSATFAVGQFILITGATDQGNNGLFEVLSHVGTTLTIRGVGTTDVVEDFSQNQFVADTTVAGAITRLNVSVLRSGTDGAWEQGSGAVTPVVFTDLGSGTGNSLQQAYEVGNQITTDGGNGVVLIAGTEKLQVTATGGLDVDTLIDFDGTTFDAVASGAISLDAGAASNFTVAGAGLTLATTGSGNVTLTSAAVLDINAGSSVTIDSTAGGVSIDATDGCNFSSSAGNMTIASGGANTLILSGGVEVDITSASVDINATGGVSIDGATFSIDATTGSNLSMNANSAGFQNLSIDALNAGAGNANLAITVKTEADITASILDFNASSSATMTTTGGNTTIQTTTSGNVVLDSVGLLDVDADTGINIDSTGGGFSVDVAGASNITTTSGNLTLHANSAGADLLLNATDVVSVTSATFDVNVTSATIDAVGGGYSLDANASSNVSTTSANLTISTIFSGSLLLASAGASTYTIPSGTAAALTITDGADAFITLDSTSGFERVQLGQFVQLAKGAGIQIVTTDALTEGSICYINSSGESALADANAGTLRQGMVFGLSTGTFIATATANIVTVTGSRVPVRFVAAPAAADNGKPFYLSQTAGQATLTPPETDDDVTYQIGILIGATGADTTPDCIFQPRLASIGANVTT